VNLNLNGPDFVSVNGAIGHIMKVKAGQLGFGVDVFNVLNSNAPNALLYASGPTYLYPTVSTAASRRRASRGSSADSVSSQNHGGRGVTILISMQERSHG
jgi:hypothetical protein